MSHVDIDLDPEFAESLIAAADSVVVWSPSEIKVEPRLKLERVIAVTRQYYEPAAVRSDRGVESQGTRRDAQSLIRNEDQGQGHAFGGWTNVATPCLVSVSLQLGKRKRIQTSNWSLRSAARDFTSLLHGI